jgi:hypothetical protein
MDEITLGLIVKRHSNDSHLIPVFQKQGTMVKQRKIGLCRSSPNSPRAGGRNLRYKPSYKSSFIINYIIMDLANPAKYILKI